MKSKRETVVIALKQRNTDALQSELEAVSFPSSPRYGKHLSREQVAQLTSNKEACDSVKAYLALFADLTISLETTFCDYLIVDGPVHVWNQAFGASILDSLGLDVANFEDFSVPDHLSSSIEAILPRKHIPLQLSALKTRSIEFNEAGSFLRFPGFVYPQLLSALYGIDNSLGRNTTTDQAVYAALQQTMSPNDLLQFQQLFELPYDVVKDARGHVNDETCLGNPQSCIEANLDVQYLTSTAQHIPTMFYYWSLLFDPFLSWIVTVAHMKHSPRIWTISYGAEERFITKAYATLFNIEAMKLGLQGVTIFAASGDNGAMCLEYTQDINGTTNVSPAGCGQTCAIFPASSPLVTAVGATLGPEAVNLDAATSQSENDDRGDRFPEEKVCMAGRQTLITSGGGFSSLYSRPSFQDAFVDSYFQRSGLVGKDDKFAGRAYPDIALLGHAYITISGQQPLVVDGTSASTPVAAGIFSLINAAKVRNGGSTLGWLNPLLYTLSDDSFHDIVSGNNRCSFATKLDLLKLEYEAMCCDDDSGYSGFIAVDGWDPTTGRGSVRFEQVLNEILSVYNMKSSSTAEKELKSQGALVKNLQFGTYFAVVLLLMLCIGIASCVRCRQRSGYQQIVEVEKELGSV